MKFECFFVSCNTKRVVRFGWLNGEASVNICFKLAKVNHRLNFVDDLPCLTTAFVRRETTTKEKSMGIAKIIEISSSSKKSFDDAVKSGIEKASKTIENIEGAWVNEQKVVVQDGKVVEYRVNLKITFVLK